MTLIKDIQELINANVITPQTGEDILAYYKGKAGNSQNRLFAVFGIMGAMLVGLGIILIIAHNWDELPRTIKTTFAFVPVIIGQLMGGYVILKTAERCVAGECRRLSFFCSWGMYCADKPDI